MKMELISASANSLGLVPPRATLSPWHVLGLSKDVWQRDDWMHLLKGVAIGVSTFGFSYAVLQYYRSNKKLLGEPRSIGDSREKAVSDMTAPLSISTRVTRLMLYPVKSCVGIEVDSFYAGEMGPELHTEDGIVVRDRSWMVVTGKSIMETQRKHPHMVLIRTSIQGEWLVLDAPDMPSLRVPLRGPDVPEDNLSESWDATSFPPHIINTNIFGTDVSGVDCGEEASEWLSSFMDQKNTRLIYHPVSFGGRKVAIGEIDSSVKFWKEGDKIIFADDGPYLLMSKGSMDDFNRRLPNDPVSVLHFRPNIFVSNCPPYEEDKWGSFMLGEAEFTNAKPCGRCIVTTVSPETGTKSRPDVLETLRGYRLTDKPEWKTAFGDSPLMAINLSIQKTGRVSVGDIIQHNHHLAK